MQAKEVLPLKRSEYLARRRRARVAVMMLFALIMGFVSAAPPVVTGCQAQDLTPVPDTSVLSPAISVPVQAEPAAPVLPEKWVCLTFDDGPSKTRRGIRCPRYPCGDPGHRPQPRGIRSGLPCRFGDSDRTGGSRVGPGRRAARRFVPRGTGRRRRNPRTVLLTNY